MKDMLIAIIILAVLVAMFSCCDVPEQPDPPPTDTHGEGSRESGESDIAMPGKGDPPAESPKTGCHFYFF